MHVARMFASLDRISGGRAGWNVVTSATPSEAENFGMARLPDAAERYDRAEEFVDVVTGLWDSWEDGAFLGDKESGLFVDPARVHELRHEGRHFRVRGPLPVPRSPQGRPVLVQAGTSGPGRALAGRVAEVVFCVQQSIDSARAFAQDIRQIAAAQGRDPAHLRVMPGAMIVVAPTRAEAEDRYAALQALIPDVVGVAQLSGFMGIDLSGYPLDGPLPPLDHVPDIGHGRMMHRIATAEGLTIRQACRRFAGQRGHLVVVGDPAGVADTLQDWVEAGACDGFNVMPPTFPKDLRDIVELLVPELRRRGLMRTGYAGRTLRDHLGLPVPANRWQTAAAPG
jgi:alkanesulfonate monooxygenase